MTTDTGPNIIVLQSDEEDQVIIDFIRIDSFCSVREVLKKLEPTITNEQFLKLKYVWCAF